MKTPRELLYRALDVVSTAKAEQTNVTNALDLLIYSDDDFSDLTSGELVTVLKLATVAIGDDE